MSSATNLEADDDMMCCASCGIAEKDEIKLKKCTACKSIRYCGVECQKKHRPQHKKGCKKRAAELRDEILFKQPESSNWGDCPICLLPLPIENEKSTMMSCCCKVICIGCEFANDMREFEGRLDPKCPFCRHPTPKTQEEAGMTAKNRIEANDPVAMCQMGKLRYEEGNFKSAVEYFSKAAELGDTMAHYELSLLYREGKVVEKDKKKEMYHLEQAAIGGHPDARHNLGCEEWDNCRHERAVKHFVIAAKLGYNDSADALKEGFKRGYVSKEELAAALRGHQAAVDATKSPQREVAEAYLDSAARRGE
jgi:tetratricopeptide (TPR) repeat protein